MLLVKHLGSDSPLYFSLLEHPCTHDLKVIASSVVTLALWFRGHSRCPQKNNRPRVSLETGTCTNSSTEYCSAKWSPLASESPREWIQLRQSVLQFQIPPNTHLRGHTQLDSRELAASTLRAKSAACAVVAVHMLSTSGRHSAITTVLCPAFQMRNATQGVHYGSFTFWHACSWTAGQVRSTQVRST
jgi:hypothetical protein